MAERFAWADADVDLIRSFCAEGAAPDVRYAALFRYVLSGYLHYATKHLSGACYPGAPSSKGPQADRMEGFTRIAPVMAAWVAGGRGARMATLQGVEADLLDVLARGICSGTDPASPGYWGDPCDKAQRVCEAADVALALWLSRQHLWDVWPEDRRRPVAAWLQQAQSAGVHDNNWHLVPVIIGSVLGALNCRSDPDGVRRHYERVREFYVGDGWFRDGPAGRFDYYNAWQFHYLLYWLSRIRPEFDPDFIADAAERFVERYKFFFSPKGFPIMGRSICYRMAAPVPLVTASLGDSAHVSPGLARRALDCVWRHFVSRGAMNVGRPTQGYYGADLCILDHYSGPASPLWSLRSLVPAFCVPHESTFWQAPLESLPVEENDFRVQIPGIGWDISGCKQTGDVRIMPAVNKGKCVVRLRSWNLWDRALRALKGRPRRPRNKEAQYDQPVYSAVQPFCCTAASLTEGGS